jgi:hypothetical protein
VTLRELSGGMYRKFPLQERTGRDGHGLRSRQRKAGFRGEVDCMPRQVTLRTVRLAHGHGPGHAGRTPKRDGIVCNFPMCPNDRVIGAGPICILATNVLSAAPSRGRGPGCASQQLIRSSLELSGLSPPFCCNFVPLLACAEGG